MQPNQAPFADAFEFNSKISMARRRPRLIGLSHDDECAIANAAICAHFP